MLNHEDTSLKITATEIKDIGQIISGLIDYYETLPRNNKADIFDLLSKLLEERTNKIVGAFYENDWQDKTMDIETKLEVLAREVNCLGQITADLVSYYETFPPVNKKEIFALLNKLTKERTDMMVNLAYKKETA